MGHLLGISLGLFHHKIAFYTLLYFATVPFLIKRLNWTNKFKGKLESNYNFGRTSLYLILGLGQLMFLHSLVKNAHVIYPSNFKIQVIFDAVLSLTQSFSVCLFTILCATILTGKNELGKKLIILYRILAVAIISLLICAQFLIPALSPHPLIDVFVNNTAAVDFFLKGKNPYSQTYVDIYHGLFSYLPGFLYFPGLLFCLAPFRYLFGDIRFTFVFAQILNAILIYRIAKRRGPAKPGKNQQEADRQSVVMAEAILPFLLPALWLSFPVTYHVLEQSWTDTLLIAFTFLIVDSIDLRRWAWVGILAGLVFTTKQYGFVISLFAILRVTQVGGLYQGIRCACFAAGAFSAVLIPFIISNFKGLYAMSIQAQTGPGIRTDSLGMSAFFALKWGYYLPGVAQVLIGVLGIGGGVWMLWSDPVKKTDRMAVALFFSYGCSFLFGKWSFCNYHYLLASFLMLYLATVLEARESLNLRIAQSSK
ncbi:MAG: hypothetical protein ABIQ95_09160 [Bdellovibrionia bacterium]